MREIINQNIIEYDANPTNLLEPTIGPDLEKKIGMKYLGIMYNGRLTKLQKYYNRQMAQSRHKLNSALVIGKCYIQLQYFPFLTTNA